MIQEECFTIGDIRNAVLKMQQDGATLIAHGLCEEFRKKLLQEVLLGPFEKIDTRVGLVDEVFERYAFLYEVKGMPHLELLRQSTENLIRSAHEISPALAHWSAKDVVIQKYGKEGGLSGHMDLKRHPHVIVIWTLVGSARIELLETRYGPVTKTFYPNPGDLLLLRGTGPADMPEERPFHRVSGNLLDDHRISATFRDNTTPEKVIPQFSYTNFSCERIPS